MGSRVPQLTRRMPWSGVSEFLGHGAACTQMGFGKGLSAPGTSVLSPGLASIDAVGHHRGMKRTLILLMLALVAPSCDSNRTSRTTADPSVSRQSVSREPENQSTPEPVKEPDHVTVSHVLVAFQGAMRSRATRSREEARVLALDILKQAQAGADFKALMKQHSDDPGAGTYEMANHGVRNRPGEFARGGMAPAFGDVGFKLGLGEVGLGEYDTKKSPFGYHIIKRVK